MIRRTIARRVTLAVSAAIILGIGVTTPAVPQDRMPPIPPEKRTDAEKKVTADFKALRGFEPNSGPFSSMIRNPGLLLATGAMGQYLRFESPMKNARVRELTILYACRAWTSQLEWTGHYPLALQAGLKKEIIDAIAEGRRPSGMAEDEEIAYDLSAEIQHNKSVSDVTYQRAVAKFGEQGVLDILGLSGYYSYLAIFANTLHDPPLTNGAPPLKNLPE